MVAPPAISPAIIQMCEKHILERVLVATRRFANTWSARTGGASVRHEATHGIAVRASAGNALSQNGWQCLSALKSA
jgi:hypothetical protein